MVCSSTYSVSWTYSTTETDWDLVTASVAGCLTSTSPKGSYTPTASPSRMFYELLLPPSSSLISGLIPLYFGQHQQSTPSVFQFGAWCDHANQSVNPIDTSSPSACHRYATSCFIGNDIFGGPNYLRTYVHWFRKCIPPCASNLKSEFPSRGQFARVNRPRRHAGMQALLFVIHCYTIMGEKDYHLSLMFLLVECHAMRATCMDCKLRSSKAPHAGTKLWIMGQQWISMSNIYAALWLICLFW